MKPERNGPKNGSEATRFKSGNPGGPGRPKGSRDKLQRDFIATLAADFDAHGAEAIAKCREQNPAAYIKAIASLMPRELEVRRPLDGLSDEELGAIAEHLRPLATAQTLQ